MTLNETVVVGYGTQKKVNLTGAISVVDDKALKDRSSHNLVTMLQGSVPGLNITTQSGNPGSSGKLNIRGFTSINEADPIVLIDGAIGDLEDVNPNDVASISVIKDAAAAAVYGARAAYGVILVTTKNGSSDDDVRVVKVYEDRKAEPDELVATDGKEIGEVIISTPAKSPYCYYNNPEETSKKYYKDFIYTNDLATWDKNNFVTIVGRKDDMIISSGENIYPTQVEEVLNMNPKVKDCIVTAVPDRVRGQLVTAYVIKNDDSLTVEELDNFCKESAHIANYKRPRYYRFVDDIPFNATGKKLHFKIKQTAAKDLEAGLLTKI